MSHIATRLDPSMGCCSLIVEHPLEGVELLESV